MLLNQRRTTHNHLHTYIRSTKYELANWQIGTFSINLGLHDEAECEVVTPTRHQKISSRVKQCA